MIGDHIHMPDVKWHAPYHHDPDAPVQPAQPAPARRAQWGAVYHGAVLLLAVASAVLITTISSPKS